MPVADQPMTSSRNLFNGWQSEGGPVSSTARPSLDRHHGRGIPARRADPNYHHRRPWPLGPDHEYPVTLEGHPRTAVTSMASFAFPRLLDSPLASSRQPIALKSVSTRMAVIRVIHGGKRTWGRAVRQKPPDHHRRGHDRHEGVVFFWRVRSKRPMQGNKLSKLSFDLHLQGCEIWQDEL
jgi:hypothetical protein